MCLGAVEVECAACGTAWQPEDTDFAGKCPRCGEAECEINPCETCPLETLKRVRATSLAGRLLDRALQLEMNIADLSIPWSEITAQEMSALRILRDERKRREVELSEQAANQ